MKRLLLLPLLLLTIFTDGFAQYYTNQNKVWVFGKNAGLDFNSGDPVPFRSAIFAPEGGASVCNNTGQLLFYTDGDTVYNRKHEKMSNGSHIVSFSTLSTTQSSVIAPVIGTSNQYYIFSMERLYASASSSLAYSIVDISLDGGYGDVVAFPKGVIIEDSLAEKMITITGDNNNIWLLVHLRDSAVFHAYEITVSGINMTPVVSRSGLFSRQNAYAIGELKVSSNRRKLVSQMFRALNAKGTEIHNFDPSTGIVSNCILLDSLSSQYGAEFSPDGTKLYTQLTFGPTYDTSIIWQYNISVADSSAIISSKTQIAYTPNHGVTTMKLAPNGKIYFRGSASTGSVSSEYLSCINMPNATGSACGYIPNAVHLEPGTLMSMGLPNLYVTTDTLAWAEVNMVNPTPTISLFPNPTNAQLSITSSTEIGHIKIFDITGRQVHNETINSKTATVDVSKLGEGIYLVNINSSFTRTFVKR